MVPFDHLCNISIATLTENAILIAHIALIIIGEKAIVAQLPSVWMASLGRAPDGFVAFVQNFDLSVLLIHFNHSRFSLGATEE